MTSFPASAAAASRPTLPHFELQQISPHGAVFRSNRACEPGTSFAFGIHLPASRRHRLLDLEAIVVDCHATGAGNALRWEVTLLFDGVTPDQESALRAAARLPLPEAEPFPQGASFFDCAGVCRPGLN